RTSSTRSAARWVARASRTSAMNCVPGIASAKLARSAPTGKRSRGERGTTTSAVASVNARLQAGKIHPSPVWCGEIFPLQETHREQADQGEQAGQGRREAGNRQGPQGLVGR